ncbi:MAG: tetratricopeptide repeat protein [Mariniphaga sp.]
MKTCVKCNSSYDDDKKFCKKCGGSLTIEYQIDPRNVAKKTVLEDRLKADPLNVELLHEYAQFLFNNLLFKEAITASYKILAINENDGVAKDLLFKSYCKLKMLREALDIGKQLLAEKPTDIFLLEELARMANESGNSDRASEYFEKILSLQPSNVAALYNNALILVDKNEIEKAIGIFNRLHKDGDNQRVTTIYAGIGKALNDDYKTAVDLLRPIMLDDKKNQNDLDHNRGLIYLAYSLCQTSADFTLIQNWIDKLDIKILRNTQYEPDKLTVVKLADFLINHNLKQVSPSPEASNQVAKIVKSYLPSGFFTPSSNSMLAEIWYSIGNKQVELKLLADALNSFQKSCDFAPTESKYKEKYNEIKILFEKDNRKSNRKTNLGIAAVIVGLILLAVLVLAYERFAEKKAFDLAKKENNISSYQIFLSKYPKGKYSPEIKQLWQSFRTADSVLVAALAENAKKGGIEILKKLRANNRNPISESFSFKKNERWATNVTLPEGKVYWIIVRGASVNLVNGQEYLELSQNHEPYFFTTKTAGNPTFDGIIHGDGSISNVTVVSYTDKNTNYFESETGTLHFVGDIWLADNTFKTGSIVKFEVKYNSVKLVGGKIYVPGVYEIKLPGEGKIAFEGINNANSQVIVTY